MGSWVRYVFGVTHLADALRTRSQFSPHFAAAIEVEARVDHGSLNVDEESMAIARDLCGQAALRSRFEVVIIRLNSEATKPIIGEAMPFFDSRELGYHRRSSCTQGTV
jgi:hypothetical protein